MLILVSGENVRKCYDEVYYPDCLVSVVYTAVSGCSGYYKSCWKLICRVFGIAQMHR